MGWREKIIGCVDLTFRLFKADRWMILSMNDSLLDKDFVTKWLIYYSLKELLFFMFDVCFGKVRVESEKWCAKYQLYVTLHHTRSIWVIGAKLWFTFHKLKAKAKPELVQQKVRFK